MSLKLKKTIQNTSKSFKSWDRLDESQRKILSGFVHSRKWDMSSNPTVCHLSRIRFPEECPPHCWLPLANVWANVHPDDTVVVEMSSENISSKMRHAFTVQELKEVVSRYEEQMGRKVKPIPLETVLDPDDDGPITFEIRHGKREMFSSYQLAN
ncbi:uncharacterized protein CEXT_652161 [Caerostris extrusa]|uniref:Uncharacterized protein n=1 Tax=Caerostris extrusa TaxID=172846 RepID=A0AAV4SCY6_CAEEX|nr:uncharacterized protein CEXT_652161 [Caerostris extrusa]